MVQIQGLEVYRTEAYQPIICDILTVCVHSRELRASNKQMLEERSR